MVYRDDAIKLLYDMYQARLTGSTDDWKLAVEKLLETLVENLEWARED